MKPYIRNTNHSCEPMIFTNNPIVIEYDEHKEKWVFETTDCKTVNIKYCPFCGEKLKTCTKFEAIVDFIYVFFNI